MGEGSTHGRNSRRSFVNWILGTSLGAFAASVLYPLVSYVVPPEQKESASNSVTLSLTPDEIEPDSGEIFKFGNDPAILIRTPEGEFRAFAGTCTHLSCIVQYRSDIDHIWCACHDGHYDLNGRNIKGPPPRPLEEYVVNVQDDEIIVSKKA